MVAVAGLCRAHRCGRVEERRILGAAAQLINVRTFKWELGLGIVGSGWGVHHLALMLAGGGSCCRYHETDHGDACQHCKVR
jgi:hypothetical protein